jgi:hypothetical protein
MNAVEVYVNHRQLLATELADFIRQYKGEQPELIEALADKIDHMCNTIGSPSSVIPMLKSIIKGKLKVWSTDWDSKGKQLDPRIHISQLKREYCDINHKGEVIYEKFVKGHFRWNHGAYVANYYTRNYIKAYYIDNNVREFNKGNNPFESGFRMQIASAHAVKHAEHTYTVEFQTTKGNDYRFVYYPNSDLVTCSWGPDKCTDIEINYTKKMINDKFKTKF